LIVGHAHVVRALADELRIRRTMSGREIDVTIDAAIVIDTIEREAQRRSEWKRREESAARFHGTVFEAREDR
jgi:hypothetical protein